MRLTLLRFGLAALVWAGAARADTAGEVENLEASAAAHVADFTALDAQRTNLSLQYRALIDRLTQRLKFGTAPKNPALEDLKRQAETVLTALGDMAGPLATAAADLTDDAARTNALARGMRSELAAPGADAAALQPLAARVAAASDTLDRMLGQALETRRKQAEMTKTETGALAGLSQAIEIGHLPAADRGDTSIAELLAPPQLIQAQPTPTVATGGRFVVEFGLFPAQDDAGFVMARLSILGVQSHFTTAKDKQGRPVYRVLTHGFATRPAAEAAAADLGRHDLHPSRVIETPAG
jgi:hypothetical protein